MKQVFLVIALLALAAGLRADDAKPLHVPDGLTVTVGTDGVMQLVWNPIYDDDLMGYSVWKRREGAGGEYTRISIPFRSGKQVKKLPMTTKARYLFKDAPGARMEYVVVSEFESGRSLPSAPVHTRLARTVELAMAPGATPPSASLRAGSSEAASANDVSQTSASAEPGSGLSSIAGKNEEAASQASDSNRDGGAGLLPGVTRSLLAPAGTFHTDLQADVLFDVTNGQGHQSLEDLGLYVVGQPDYDRVTKHNWTTTDITRTISFPLGVEYGILPALELGASIPYRLVYSYESSFIFGSDTFDSYEDYEKVSGSGFGNPAFQIRVQPVPTQPLILTLKATVPNGQRTRLQAWNDFILEGIQTAGMDDGVSRLQVRADFGQKGVQPGLFYTAAYMPGATENSAWDAGGGISIPTHMNYGQQIELGVGYTFPWAVSDKPGAATTWLTWRSIDSGDWSFNNVDQTKGLAQDAPYNAALFRSFTGVNINPENQLEWGLGLSQNLYAARDSHGDVKYLIDSQGKFTAALKPDGYVIGVSGGLFY